MYRSKFWRGEPGTCYFCVFFSVGWLSGGAEADLTRTAGLQGPHVSMAWPLAMGLWWQGHFKSLSNMVKSEVILVLVMLTFWWITFDVQRFVIGFPKSGPWRVPPRSTVRLDALRIIVVPDAGDELPQLGTDHPKAQIVLLQGKGKSKNIFETFNLTSTYVEIDSLRSLSREKREYQ